MKPNVAYVVVRGWYSDYRIACVFTNQEAAIRYARHWAFEDNDHIGLAYDGYRIETYPLWHDDSWKESEGFTRDITWYADKDPEILAAWDEWAANKWSELEAKGEKTDWLARLKLMLKR
jgi:hypothetical protein